MYIITWMTGNSDTARFLRMFVLPVTSYGTHAMPTICFNQLDKITNLHLRNEPIKFLFS